MAERVATVAVTLEFIAIIFVGSVLPALEMARDGDVTGAAILLIGGMLIQAVALSAMSAPLK